VRHLAEIDPRTRRLWSKWVNARCRTPSSRCDSPCGAHLKRPVPPPRPGGARALQASNAGAKELVKVLLDRDLIPAELQSHFSALRAAMESGLPTLRNKTSGHGQGPEPRYLPPHFAAYALHLAAADIVFLVEAHNFANGSS
jgi:hypothetical protein